MEKCIAKWCTTKKVGTCEETWPLFKNVRTRYDYEVSEEYCNSAVRPNQTRKSIVLTCGSKEFSLPIPIVRSPEGLHCAIVESGALVSGVFPEEEFSRKQTSSQ